MIAGLFFRSLGSGGQEKGTMTWGITQAIVPIRLRRIGQALTETWTLRLTRRSICTTRCCSRD